MSWINYTPSITDKDPKIWTNTWMKFPKIKKLIIDLSEARFAG